ncbi:MAG: hypothetical protein AAFQ98_26260, partial [Bacteroidota bacterium]
MNKSLLILGAVAALVWSCDGGQQVESLSNERDSLNLQVDSLQTIVEEQMYQAEMLSQISQYLDSVEVDRQWLRTNLETGIPEDDYIARMKRINQYLEEADFTIGELEKTRVAYLSQVRRLKKDLEEAVAEIEQLQLV